MTLSTWLRSPERFIAFSAFPILPVPFQTGMPHWNLSAKRQKGSSLFWPLMNSRMLRQKIVL